MFDMTIEKTANGELTLFLDGELTIVNTRLFYERVREIMEKPEALTVHLRKASSVDCTFMQIICSVHRAYHAAGKKFNFRADDAEAVTAAGWTGIAANSGCVHSVFGECLLAED